VAFDDLEDDALAAARARVAADALHSARIQAAQPLVSGPGAGAGDATTAVDVLLACNTDDTRYELLRAFEKSWAALVVRILAGVADPSAALQDARERGVTVAAIAQALDITQQGVYQRYGELVRRPRSRPDQA
jgi:hypothetical protein